MKTESVLNDEVRKAKAHSHSQIVSTMGIRCCLKLTFHPRCWSIISASQTMAIFCQLLLYLPCWLHPSNMEGGKDDHSHGKKMSMVVGPWGGDGGTSWDDGSFSGVREITLVYDRCIDWIRVVYDKNGKPVSGQKHGGVGGNKTAEIKLQYPEEKLINVSGHYCPVVHGGSPVIRSLTIRSNRRIFGPFGVEEGTPFSLSMDGGQIVGFQGRSGWYLDAIGFHLSQTRSTTKPFQTIQLKLRRFASMVISASKDREGKVKKNKSMS